MELANFGPLLHTASTSTNNSAVTSLVEFLVPLKKIHGSVPLVFKSQADKFFLCSRQGMKFPHIFCYIEPLFNE